MARDWWRGPLAAVALVAQVACSHGAAPIGASALPPQEVLRQLEPATAPSYGKIKHIIFVVQENRTFNNLFGGPRPFPGALTTAFGKSSDGKTFPLRERSLGNLLDLDNYYPAYLNACDPPNPPPFTVGQPSPCRMDGFNKNWTWKTQDPYSYVDYSQTKPYWDIASKYTLGDHFFMGHNSESYTAHQFLFSGQSNWVNQAPTLPWWAIGPGAVFIPWGCDSPGESKTFMIDPSTWHWPSTPNGPAACFNYPSLADRLNAAHLTWRIYLFRKSVNINGFDANRSIRDSPIWHDANVFRAPETSFLTDIKGTAHPLGAVTWILPGAFDSDHPGIPFGTKGPSWVADIVNAVGKSRYWHNTVIFILWDDWGGFYDPVAPYVVRDAQGPGFRVPLIVVSPYARRGYVAKTDTEFGTLLAFAEETFNLPSLGADDASPYLNTLSAFFDWRRPRGFRPVMTYEPASYFEHFDERGLLERLRAEHRINSHFLDDW